MSVYYINIMMHYYCAIDDTLNPNFKEFYTAGNFTGKLNI